MKVIILAAGKATRITPFSQTKPKALIKLANIPLLEHTFKALTKVTPMVTDVILVTGYKEAMIKEHFKDSYENISISYVTQHEQKGTGHAALQAKEFFKTPNEQFLLLNGDDIYSWQDLQSLTQFPSTILLQEKEDVSAFGVVEVTQQIVHLNNQDVIVHKVKSFVEKPQGVPPSNFINTGAFAFTSKLFPILEDLRESPRGEYELTDAVKALAKQDKMHAIFTKHLWSPVGYPWNIIETTKLLLEKRLNNQIFHHGTVSSGAVIEEDVSIDRGSKIAKGVRITGLVAIGKNVTIKENCTVSGTVAIADNSVIEKNCIISNTIIGSSTIVKQNCRLHDSVIGDSVIIQENMATNTILPDQTIKVQIKGKLFDTKLHQLGAFIADKIQLNQNTNPGEIVLG